MSLLDLLRQEYVKAKVISKCRSNNGNLGLVVEDSSAHRRYHVEFRDGYKGPGVENLFGLMKEPFARKSEYLDRLISPGDYLGLTLSYSKSPFREAYYLHSVQKSPPNERPNNLISFPYNSDRRSYYEPFGVRR